MLENNKQKRDLEDMGMELSANLREIRALQTRLSPIEERLAAELNASNHRAVALQAQLASITTGQAGQVDLTASDAQGTAAHRDRAQLIARIKLLETEAMMAREDADLDRAKNPLTIYKEDQQIYRCSDLANELFSAGQQVEELQRQLSRERAKTANLPPDTVATHLDTKPAAAPGVMRTERATCVAAETSAETYAVRYDEDESCSKVGREAAAHTEEAVNYV